MILLLGNNESIRHDILMSLFMKKYYVSEQSIEDGEFLTKPFMTVYINPNTEQIERIKNENTVCIVAKNNVKFKPPVWMSVIPYGKETSKEIMKIYEQRCPFGKGREVFGILCMEGNKFAIGGKYVYMTPKQLQALKILLYNSQKQFTTFEISSYFDYVGDPAVKFANMVREINWQCNRVNRESPIAHKGDKYFINPEILVN